LCVICSPCEIFSNSLARVAASGSFLFETRLGCLQPVVPGRTCQFIDAIRQMIETSLYLIVGDRLHRALDTSYWRRHKHAWDQLFHIGDFHLPLTVCICDSSSISSSSSSSNNIIIIISLSSLSTTTTVLIICSRNRILISININVY